MPYTHEGAAAAAAATAATTALRGGGLALNTNFAGKGGEGGFSGILKIRGKGGRVNKKIIIILKNKRFCVLLQ